MKEIKVGIVGLGRLGSVHAQNLAFKIPGFFSSRRRHTRS